MADKTTYIKLDRNIIRWGWYQNPKILSVFIWLLVKANIKEGHFQKDVINRGSLATSNAHIAEGCGLTIDNVRTALANLESTGEISRITRNHYQIITIVNYESYQSDIPKTRGQIPSNTDSKSQATAIANPNNQRIKERKNGKKNIPPNPQRGNTSPYGEFIRGTEAFKNRSHLLLKRNEGTVDDIPDRYLEMFDNFQDYYDWRNQ